MAKNLLLLWLLSVMVSQVLCQSGSYMYYSSFTDPGCSSGVRRELDILMIPCDSTYNGCFDGTLGECKNSFEAPSSSEFPNTLLLYAKSSDPALNGTCKNKSIQGWTYFNPRCGQVSDSAAAQTRCGDYGALLYSFIDPSGNLCQSNCRGCVSANPMATQEGCGVDSHGVRDVFLTCNVPTPYLNYTPGIPV